MAALELIDTWWDVNYVKKFRIDMQKLELIDTWWDVNRQDILLI